jgi:hypothetical protein
MDVHLCGFSPGQVAGHGVVSSIRFLLSYRGALCSPLLTHRLVLLSSIGDEVGFQSSSERHRLLCSNDPPCAVVVQKTKNASMPDLQKMVPTA